MNERILKLVEQARQYAWENETHWSANAEREALFEQKFAELIVRECVKGCQQEWYDLNNEEVESDMTPRDIGIRVGQKNGVLNCISKIKKHFGVEE